MTEIQRLKQRVKIVLCLFMIGVVLSGLTAFSLEWELYILFRWIGNPNNQFITSASGLADWITHVYRALQVTYRQYPFIAYGTDWLAFAHIVIAIAFWGPLKDPVRNRWVIEFGLITCVLVLPLALIMGPLRGIPFFWRLIDCSFGVVGFIPLWWCRNMVLRIEKLASTGAPAAVS